MSPFDIYSVDDIEYSKAFIKGDYIIKIFPAKDDPGSFSYNASGIYFEKINKHTGQAAISSKIINSTEFNSGQSQRYIMSNVIADGDNFIFGCNNGYVYCYDLSGSLVWKKANFPIEDSNLGMGKAHLFYDEGRIYFFSQDGPTGANSLCCLDAKTGQTVWQTGGANHNSSKGVFFDKERIFIIEPCGVYFQNKRTGQFINESPYTGCSGFWGSSIGSIDGVTAIVFSKTNEIGIIHTPVPDPMTRLSFPNNPFSSNYFLEDGLIYGGNAYLNTAFPNSLVFACYNFSRETFNWQTIYPLPSPSLSQNEARIFNYKPFKDDIFLFTNFHFGEDGKAVLNDAIKPNTVTNGVYESGAFPGIIILNKQSGSIKKQIKKIPAGANATLPYNFCIE